MTRKVEPKLLSQIDYNALTGKMAVHLPPKLLTPLLGHIAGLEKEIEKLKAQKNQAQSGQPAIQLAPEKQPDDKPAKPTTTAPEKKGGPTAPPVAAAKKGYAL